MELLVSNPLLGLIVVIAVGYLVGGLRVGTFSLGIAAVLFSGLAISALEPRITVAPIVYELGLVLFVYTIGLASGPGFFAALRHKGIRDNKLVLGALVGVAALAYGLVKGFGLDELASAGMFAGALTNTPALAAVIEAVPKAVGGGDVGLPVIGYSLAYPIGVLGPIAAIAILARVWKIDHDQEARDAGVAPSPLETWSVRVTSGHATVVHFLAERCGAEVLVSRILQGKRLRLPEDDDILQDGDIVNLVGTAENLEIATAYLGERLDEPLLRSDLDFRRVFVSNPEIVGRPIGSLDLRHKHDMLITRIRRGDIDMVAHDDSVLQLGDRVRVVAPRDQMDDVSKVVGDSYQRLSEIDILSFAIGIAVGLLVGMIPIPMPGGQLTLGPAGGPLLVAVVLGHLGRTGRFVWRIPYSSNLTIRQIGLVLFLAGVGVKAGPGFAKAVQDPGVWAIMAIGAVLTLAGSMLVLVVGHKVYKIPFGQAGGILAGLQTQPAALVYASEMSRNELPNLGYTTVYPLAMVVKIVAAQLLLLAFVA